LTLSNVAKALEDYPVNNDLQNKVVATKKKTDAGSVRGVDLTVKQALGQYKDSFTVNHLVDCIRGWEGDYEWDLMVGNIAQGNLGELPAPFKPKSAIANGFKLNMVISKVGNGKYDIWRYFLRENSIECRSESLLW
jgi:hypothetical protein